MGIQCPNCKTTLGCGCQKRTARNGAQVCAKCIASYEAQLTSNPSTPKQTTTTLFQPKK